MNRMFILSIEVEDSWHDLTDEEVREMLKENEEGRGIKVTNISRIDMQGKVWPCWNLSEKDITGVAEEKELSLEGKDIEEIAQRTKKGIENALGEWPWDIIVEEAIKNTEVSKAPSICKLCDNGCPDCKEVRPDIPINQEEAS